MEKPSWCQHNSFFVLRNLLSGNFPSLNNGETGSDVRNPGHVLDRNPKYRYFLLAIGAQTKFFTNERFRGDVPNRIRVVAPAKPS